MRVYGVIYNLCLDSKRVRGLRARGSPCPLLAPVWRISTGFPLSSVSDVGPAVITQIPTATGWPLWIPARCSGISLYVPESEITSEGLQ